MNLVPIDTGGAMTGVTTGDAATGGDFAALIAGLMSGDTQIVPVLDIPVGEISGEGDDQPADVPAGVDDSEPALDFVGSPPPRLEIPASAEAPEAADTADGVVHDALAPGSKPSAVEALATPAAPRVARTEVEPLSQADLEVGLASVHPISKHMAFAAALDPAPNVGASATPGATALTHLDPPDVRVAAVAPEAPAASTADTPVDPVDGLPNAVPIAATAMPANAKAGEHTAETVAGHVPVDASTLPTDKGDLPASNSPADRRPEQESRVRATIAAEPHVTQPEIEVEPGAPTRPSGARPVGTVSPTAMVGIARRVEEAIAALATKADPKIVTLQLDELDGLRLTVALRSDGLHLSSSDAGLTSEIERALATRGFDMASDGRRHEQETDDGAADGWKPEQAPGRPLRRTNPSGIRL